jgi:hypothetical protein
LLSRLVDIAERDDSSPADPLAIEVLDDDDDDDDDDGRRHFLP